MLPEKSGRRLPVFAVPRAFIQHMIDESGKAETLVCHERVFLSGHVKT